MMYLMSSMLLDFARPRKTRIRDVLEMRYNQHCSNLKRNKDIPRHNGDDSEAEEDAGPSDENHEPEPEEDIDLLVDDVQGQNTET